MKGGEGEWREGEGMEGEGNEGEEVSHILLTRMVWRLEG